MSSLDDRIVDGDDPGLCADCDHLVRVQSPRGSVFALCGMSKHDARFPKYPVLPVTRCAAHAPRPVIQTGDASE